jgi:hypothetical protein
MTRVNRISGSAVALAIALLFTVSVPVFAESGSGRTGSSDDSSGITTSIAPRTEAEQNTTEVETHNTSGRQTIREDRQQLIAEHQSTQQARQQLAANKKVKTAEQKQKVCEAHKQGLTRKFANIVTNSDRIKTRIDAVYTKAQTYQTKNNVTVDNSLLTSATAAQQTAADSIANLKTVQPSLDCNNTSVSSDVANFKSAAQKTRDDLKAYRTAVKNYLHALIEAKQAAKTEGAQTND